MYSELEWLMKTIKENPTLEVIPIVREEVIEKREFPLGTPNRITGRSQHMGELGYSEVQMYLRNKRGVRLFGDCDYIDTIVEYTNYTKEQCELMSDEELEKVYFSLPWEKAIFVYVDWLEYLSTKQLQEALYDKKGYD